ncbi:hypothetical protein SALBM217S_00021 [Streptomyces griseoloalbus]
MEEGRNPRLESNTGDVAGSAVGEAEDASGAAGDASESRDAESQGWESRGTAYREAGSAKKGRPRMAPGAPLARRNAGRQAEGP